MSDISTVIQKKICMLGDFAVGKTSLTRRFVEGQFDDRYLSTIGVKISRRTVNLPELPDFNLLLWDLAGSEEFSGVQSSYLQGASGALLVCDMTRLSTLASIKIYIQRLRSVSPQAAIVIAGNKSDLQEQQEIEPQRLSDLADKTGASWFQTSAKTGLGVEDAFYNLSLQIMGIKLA